jgi:hypothetical protein
MPNVYNDTGRWMQINCARALVDEGTVLDTKVILETNICLGQYGPKYTVGASVLGSPRCMLADVWSWFLYSRTLLTR